MIDFHGKSLYFMAFSWSVSEYLSEIMIIGISCFINFNPFGHVDFFMFLRLRIEWVVQRMSCKYYTRVSD